MSKRKYAKFHTWTDEQAKFIKDNIEGTPYKKMWEMINHKFDLDLTFNQVHAFIGRNGLRNNRNQRFKKGEVPWKKDMKGLQIGGKETQFKKGQVPYNYRPIDSERIDSSNGYVVVKVQDEGDYTVRWRHKHVVLWEKHHGKVPKSHVIVFLDSDKTNITIENLYLISRSELVRMNQSDFFSSDPEVTKAGINLVRLNQKIIDIDLKGNDEEYFQKCIAKAEKRGIREVTFIARLKRGWSLENAIYKPLNYRKPRKNS